MLLITLAQSSLQQRLSGTIDQENRRLTVT